MDYFKHQITPRQSSADRRWVHAMYYNFVRIHQTLKVTPALAAGVTDRLWEMKDLVEMLEAFESRKVAA